MGLRNQFLVGGKGERGGVARERKNLENGPYISLQTKGISEAADLFITTLIWPQDKKSYKENKVPLR